MSQKFRKLLNLLKSYLVKKEIGILKDKLGDSSDKYVSHSYSLHFRLKVDSLIT